VASRFTAPTPDPPTPTPAHQRTQLARDEFSAPSGPDGGVGATHETRWRSSVVQR